jgi:hypothetical protein
MTPGRWATCLKRGGRGQHVGRGEGAVEERIAALGNAGLLSAAPLGIYPQRGP